MAGCFYTDIINQRPSLDIRQDTTGPLYRGGIVKLHAESSDPDGHDVLFHWRAYACTEKALCDGAPYFESSDDEIELQIAMTRVDAGAGAVLGLRVVLEGVDDFGATAKPAQELWIDLQDHTPVIELRTSSSYGSVVGTPIMIFARVADEDDGPRTPALTWEVFTPMNQPVASLDDAMVKQDESDPSHYTYGKAFETDEPGEYEVRVTADDGLGLETSKTTTSIIIVVDDDDPPCLQQLTPIVATAPSAWPMSEPTLFQVHVVEDDLDPYPTINDPYLRPTKFKWWLLAPGTTREELTGVTGNSVALDPASFHPGDILELRVEIYDRKETFIPCVDGAATCSVIADNNCLQRQTWRVEVR